jgi:hypothetical protein
LKSVCSKRVTITLKGEDVMDTALIAALSAVMGSVVGGSATIATAWITQKTQSKRELAVSEVRKREQLYTEFIVECTRLAIDSYTHNISHPETMSPAYSMRNRIRLTSTERVSTAADEALMRIIRQFQAKNLTLEELDIVAQSGEDPLKEFAEACRQELKTFLNWT